MIRFAFVCSYMGESDYKVFGDGEPYEISWRHTEPSDYERQITNAKGEAFEREVVAKVGGICRKYGRQPLSRPVWEAFCQWQEAEHIKEEQSMQEFYDKIGTPADKREPLPGFSPPRPIDYNIETRTWETLDWYQPDPP